MGWSGKKKKVENRNWKIEKQSTDASSGERAALGSSSRGSTGKRVWEGESLEFALRG
jgi:hypothetical protein